jgi:hypothetical protein
MDKNSTNGDDLGETVLELVAPNRFVAEPPALSKATIPTIHIFNGRLGGTGKSTGARLLCAWYQSIDRPYTLIDTDPNCNVARAYGKETVSRWQSSPVEVVGSSNDFFNLSTEKLPASLPDSEDLLSEQILFSADAKLSYLGDRFLEIVEQHQRDVVVSLPANDALELWLDAHGIDVLIDTEAPPFKIVNWWVSFGSAASQQALVDFIGKYPHLQHVCVFNLGITSAVPNWQRFAPLPALLDLAKQGLVKNAAIQPWLSDPGILEAVEAGTPFHEILAHGWKGRRLNPAIESKIEKWLKSNWKSFEDTGFLG